MRGIPQLQSYQTDFSAAYLYQVTNPPPPNLQSWMQSIAPPPPTPQLWSAPAAAPTPSTIANTATPYYHSGPHPNTCTFCCTQGHQVRECSIVDEYVKSRCAAYVNNHIHLPNGQPVPFDGTQQGIRGSIDTWLTSQTASVSALAQVCSIFMWEQPPHFDMHNTSWIEEVVESHIIQVVDAVIPTEDKGQEFSHNIFEVFAAKRTKPSKASELSAPPPPAQVILPPINTSATSPSTLQPNLQYHYQCDAKDFRLVTELEDFLLQGKLSLTMPAHILAASSTICKDMFDRLKVRCVETNEYEAVFAGGRQPSIAPVPVLCRTTVHEDTADHSFIDN